MQGLRNCRWRLLSTSAWEPQDAKTWGWTPHVTPRAAEEGPQTHWTVLYGTAFSVETNKRCHLCLEDALHVGQGGRARPLRSLLGNVRNFVLGLEGGIQTGFSWVLEV